MTKTAEQQQPAQKATPNDKLFMETTLLRVAGALFCHDQKRAATRTQPIELNKGVAEKHIRIEPHPNYGQPGPLAHKVFVALMKKHSDYGTPIQTDVSFTQRELARLIGRSDFGGKDSEALERALHQVHKTFIVATFKNGEGKHIEDSFNIYSRLLVQRRQYPTDPIEACTVTIAGPIIASLNDDHFTCLNHFLMQRLGTIGQALYMRLFFHFANLYENNKTQQKLFLTKHYEDICKEWLGGLTILDRKSKIIREQLGSHLEQLKNAHFLASYSLEKAKTRTGLTIMFKPGTAFFVDYDRYYRHKIQGNLQFQYHGDRHDLHEPMRVAAMFVAKRTHQPQDTIANVVSSDVDVARELIKELGLPHIEKFLDYALASAKKTKFDVQRLAGLRQYVASFRELEGKAVARAKTRVAERAADARRSEKDAYDRWCDNELRRRIAALPAGERAAAETAERARHAAAGPMQASLAAIGTQIALRKLVAARDPLPDFDAWKFSQQHA